MSTLLSVVGMLNRRLGAALASGVLGSADSPYFPATGALLDSASNILTDSSGNHLAYAQH